MGTRASDWKEKPRALNRGAAAWNSTPLTAKEAIATVANRLHVHAIADASNLSAYLPALRKWLDFVEESGAMVLKTWQKDEDHLCYDMDAGIQAGKNAIAEFQHVFLEEADLGTVPWEGAFAISHTMRKLGHEESADIVLIMADPYMRQGDWKMVQPEDITEEGQSVAISLGVAERGEATKTGFRQGVRIDRAFVAEIIKKHKRAAPKGSKIFRVQPRKFLEHWHQACDTLGYWPGPPHALRHLGPSYDLLVAYRTKPQVKQRGRWAADASVQRYAKTHVYIAARAMLPDNVLRIAQQYMRLVDVRPVKPLE